MDFSQDEVREVTMHNADELLGLLPDPAAPFSAHTDELEETLQRRVPEFREAVSSFQDLLNSGKLAKMLPQLGIDDWGTLNAVRRGGKPKWKDVFP